MINYSFDDLTEMIGASAENIIASDLGLQSIGNGMYSCFMTDHRKGNNNAPTQFFADSFKFKCHDCGLLYDIKDHARSKFNEGGEQYKYLCELAGVSENSKPKQRKPVQNKKQVKKFKSNFSGLEQQQLKGSFDSVEMFQYLDSRCISEKIARLFFVSGDSNAVYLNYWANNGQNLELAKVKGRRIGDIANGKDKYLAIKGGENILYGAHLYQQQRVLIICEGEFDALAMAEGIYHVGAESHALAVSVPSGSGSFAWVESCINFLKQFEIIVVCSDADECGIKMREGLFEKLSDLDVRWIDLEQVLNTDHHNDIGDLLKTKGKKAVADLLKNVEKPYHSCGLLAKKFQDEKKRDLFFTGFYGLDRACKFKFGELAILAGESNDGKTTITRQFLIFAVRNGLRVGCMFGEETNSKFRDLTIRQAYHGEMNFESQVDYFGDNQFTPKIEVKDRFNAEFGDSVNSFQVDRVRDIEKIGDKIIDWVCHCADIEGRRVFFLDNLMKITADEESDEYKAQARFIERLYRTAQKKGVFIMMIVHTKKITGLIDQNSIHGTKKIYNTPDYVLFFQRMDRFAETKELSRSKAVSDICYQSRMPKEIDFTSFIWAHKIRDRNPSYKIDCHLMSYDYKTTCSTELLSSKYNDRIHENGWSKIVHEHSQTDHPPTKPTI